MNLHEFNELAKLLPKVKTKADPQTTLERINETMREYFKSFSKRFKKKKESDLVFILFLEPFPYLSRLREGDYDLPYKKKIYTSARQAWRAYMIALTEHKKKEAKKRKASLIT